MAEIMKTRRLGGVSADVRGEGEQMREGDTERREKVGGKEWERGKGSDSVGEAKRKRRKNKIKRR